MITDLTHIYRGIHYIEGKRIEYFEKCINYLYLSVENDIKKKEILLCYYMIVYSKIFYDNEDELKKLKERIINVYEKGLPKLDE